MNIFSLAGRRITNNDDISRFLIDITAWNLVYRAYGRFPVVNGEEINQVFDSYRRNVSSLLSLTQENLQSPQEQAFADGIKEIREYVAGKKVSGVDFFLQRDEIVKEVVNRVKNLTHGFRGHSISSDSIMSFFDGYKSRYYNGMKKVV